jgi:hypothetical protein
MIILDGTIVSEPGRMRFGECSVSFKIPCEEDLYKIVCGILFILELLDAWKRCKLLEIIDVGD